MDRNIKQTVYLATLIEQARQGTISEEKLLELDHILKNDEKCRAQFLEISYMDSALNKLFENRVELSHISFKDVHDETKMLDEALRELADDQLSSPAVELLKEKPQRERELIQKVVYPTKEKRKLSTFSKVFLAMNAAAILFFFLFLRFAPPKGGVEVATLTDSISAKWANADVSMQRGTRLYNDKSPFMLREGLIEIKFDNNAQITIEGPAEFQILDDDMIKLNYGKLYSQVPAEAYGFQVCTQHAKIIDLGTEFGIKEEIDGDTEVHVIKGQVNLVSGILNKKLNVNMLAGSARKLDAATGELKEIRCENKLFVRQINSNANLIWKGQDTVPLANILAGTLFNKIRGGIEINPSTGEYVIHENYVSGLDRSDAGDYHITDSPFVDGTFVPQGQLPQTISSTNLTWQSPKTGSGFYYNLSDRKTIYDPYTASYYPLSLRQEYLEKTSLLLHPNMGVTLDLNKIRQKMSTFDICRFRADNGISGAAKEALEKLYPDGNIPEKESPSMDFTVLLDGRVCKKLTGINLDSGTNKIDVEISPTDRFLTLVSTDGDLSYEFDWFVLANPVLEISPKE